MAYELQDGIYASQWRTWKHFDGYALALALSAVALFSLGVILAPKSAAASSSPPDPSVLRLVFWILIALTFTGYFVWFGVAFARGLRPEHILDLATGKSGITDDVKELYMRTVSGVTTLTQFGMAAVVIACLAASVEGWRRFRWPLALLLALAIARTLLNSERLAVIELVAPAVLAAAAVFPPATARLRRVVSAAPVIGLAALFTFFTASEYLRSWKGFYVNEQDSLLTFSAVRLGGYYVTALNNGATLNQLVPSGFESPYFTLNFAWKLPLIKDAIREFFPIPSLDAPEGYNAMMSGHTNIEFNNPSGLFLPMLDFGPACGLLYWLAAGFACGWLHSLYRRRSFPGLCLYPMAAVGMLEAGRVLYWAEPRAFPSYLSLALAAWLLHHRGSRQESRQLWSQIHPGSAS